MPMDAQKYDAGAIYKMVEHAIRYRNTNKDVNYSNPDLDKSRTCENYSMGIDRSDPYKYQKNRVKECDQLIPPKRLKKDRVVMVGFVFTVPENLANTDKEKEYFRCCYEWAKSAFGEENIVYSEVHRDEIHDYYDSVKKEMVSSRGHLHMGVIPFTQERGVNAKNFMTRDSLKKWHKELDQYVFKEIGEHDIVGGDPKYNGRSTQALKVQSARELEKHVQSLEKSISAKKKQEVDLDNRINVKAKDLEELDGVYHDEYKNVIAQAQKKASRDVEEIQKQADLKVSQIKQQKDDEISAAKKRLKGIQDNMNQEYKELMSEVEEYREEAERQKNAYNSMAKEYSVKLDTDKAVLEVLSAVKLNKNGDLPTCAKVRSGFRGKYVEMPYDEAVFLTNAHKRGMNELKNQTDRFATTMSYETITELLDINKELKQELDSTRHEVEQKQMEIDDMTEAIQMLPEKAKIQFYKRLDIVRGIENGAQAIDRIVQQQVDYDRER